MLKISSIHSINVAIQQIVESHDIKGVSATFDNAHPLIVTYSEFVSLRIKSVYFIDSFMRYSKFESLVTTVAKPIFDDTHPIFLYQLLISGINMQKCGLPHHSVLEIYFI